MNVSGTLVPFFDGSAMFAELTRRRAKLATEVAKLNSELTEIDGFVATATSFAERMGFVAPPSASQTVTEYVGVTDFQLRSVDGREVSVADSGSFSFLFQNPLAEVIEQEDVEEKSRLPKKAFDSRIREMLSGTEEWVGFKDLYGQAMSRWPEPDFTESAFRRRLQRASGVDSKAGGYYRIAGREAPAVSTETGGGDGGDRGDSDGEGDGEEKGPTPQAFFEIVLPPRGPLDHWMVASGDCGCGICRQWHDRRTEADRLEAAVPGHVVLGQGACGCSGCAVARQARFAFLAAENRRNLWCEISWNVNDAKELRPLAHPIMTQLHHELNRKDRSDNWWAICGGRYSCAYWIRKMAGIVTSGNIPSFLLASEAAY